MTKDLNFNQVTSLNKSVYVCVWGGGGGICTHCKIDEEDYVHLAKYTINPIPRKEQEIMSRVGGRCQHAESKHYAP